MVGQEGIGFVGHSVVDAMVLERDECSLSMWKYSLFFALTVVSRHSQVSEAVSELVARH